MKCDQEFINNLVRVMNRHYTNPNFDVRSMAAEMCISERQLQRKVKLLTGRSPVQFLRDFRLDRSLQYLREGAPVGEVAKVVGFTSHAYFTSCFRARFGITPQEVLDEPVLTIANNDHVSKRRETKQPG